MGVEHQTTHTPHTQLGKFRLQISSEHKKPHCMPWGHTCIPKTSYSCLVPISIKSINTFCLGLVQL